MPSVHAAGMVLKNHNCHVINSWGFAVHVGIFCLLLCLKISISSLLSVFLGICSLYTMPRATFMGSSPIRSSTPIYSRSNSPTDLLENGPPRHNREQSETNDKIGSLAANLSTRPHPVNHRKRPSEDLTQYADYIARRVRLKPAGQDELRKFAEVSTSICYYIAIHIPQK